MMRCGKAGGDLSWGPIGECGPTIRLPLVPGLQDRSIAFLGNLQKERRRQGTTA